MKSNRPNSTNLASQRGHSPAKQSTQVNFARFRRKRSFSAGARPRTVKFDSTCALTFLRFRLLRRGRSRIKPSNAVGKIGLDLPENILERTRK